MTTTTFAKMSRVTVRAVDMYGFLGREPHPQPGDKGKSGTVLDHVRDLGPDGEMLDFYKVELDDGQIFEFHSDELTV